MNPTLDNSCPSKPNVLLFINHLGKGGAEKQLKLIIHELNDKYSLYVACVNYKYDQESTKDNLSSTCNIINLNISESLFTFSSIVKILKFIHFIRKEKIAILHSWLFKSNTISFFIKIFVPSIYLIVSQRGSNFWYTKKHLIFSKLLYTTCNHIVTNSSSIKNEILSYNNVSHKISVIPNAIEDNTQLNDVKFHPSMCLLKDNGRFIIGCVGRFVPEKRYDDIIEAFNIVLSKKKHIHLVIIGGRGNFLDLKNSIDNSPLAPFVSFTGEVNNVFPYLKAFDLFLLASSSEGMPNAVMEAMLCGKAVVSTNVGAIPDLITHRVNGLLVAPYQPEQLAEALLELIDDRIQRKEYEKNNLLKIQQFSTGKMITQINQLWKKSCI